MAFLLSIFLVLHLLIGIVLPLRPGFKPYFYSLMEHAGLDLEQRLNRENRPHAIRFIRGIVIGVFFGFCSWFIGMVAARIGDLPYGWGFTLPFFALCINFTTPLKLTRHLLKHLKAEETAKAIDLLQPYLKEPLDKADLHTVIRRAIESIAVSLNRWLMAPVFWLLAAGPVGMTLYVAFAALAQSVMPADEKRRHFGRFARFVYKILNVAPALLSALLLAAAALFVSKSNPLRALSIILRQAGPNAEIWPVLAVAGGLGVTLGGPVKYASGYVEERGWLGPEQSSARLVPSDLSRAALLQYVFFVCMLGITSATIMIRNEIIF